jgi:SAM-dependent methyltransferase
MGERDRERERDAIVERHGPWIGHNLSLGDGIFTMGKPVLGATELNVRRVSQAALDVAGRPAEELSVLDLACGEGGFGIELAAQGAAVTAFDARETEVAKTVFASDALASGRVQAFREDVRNLNADRYGRFDVVLCVGILYHLDAPDCFQLARAVAEVATRLAIFSTALSVRPERREEWNGQAYWGRSYREGTNAWAASGNPRSFWLTRSSLLNLLQDVGFSSTMEVLNPPVLDLARHRDHVTLLAIKGERLRPHAVPQVERAPDVEGRWPERMDYSVHPSQARFARVPGFRRLRSTLGRTFGKRPAP